MGVGFYRPIEGPPLVVPSLAQDHHNNEDSSDDDQEKDTCGSTHDQGQATGELESPHHDHDGAHNDDQDHPSSQGEDENRGDDQVVFEGSPSETQARIQARVEKELRLKCHNLADVIGDVRAKIGRASCRERV